MVVLTSTIQPARSHGEVRTVPQKRLTDILQATTQSRREKRHIYHKRSTESKMADVLPIWPTLQIISSVVEVMAPIMNIIWPMWGKVFTSTTFTTPMEDTNATRQAILYSKQTLKVCYNCKIPILVPVKTISKNDWRIANMVYNRIPTYTLFM